MAQLGIEYNLAEVQDINRVVHMINQGNYDITNEQFMDKMLLDTIKLGSEHYVHLRHTQSKTLPKGTKKIQLRRWGGLTAHTTPLREGIPPVGDKTSMEWITFTATQFGRYMEFTDRINLDQIDPILAHYTKELGDVMTRTLERYARETMLSAASKMFPYDKTNVGQLVSCDKIFIDDLRFAVLRMHRMLVKPINNYYYYICSPEFIYDLIDDPLVQKYMEINQTTKMMYDNGEPFEMFQLKFVPTMLDEHYTPELDNPGEWFKGDVFSLREFAVSEEGNIIYRNTDDDGADTTGPRRLVETTSYLNDGTAIPGSEDGGEFYKWSIADENLSETNPGADVATMTQIGSSDYWYTYVHATTTWTVYYLDSSNFSGSENADLYGTVVESGALVINSGTPANDSLTVMWEQLPIHKGILYGQDALVKVGMAGESGTKTYTQGLGSAGANDPIHQRQTIGAKINSVGYGLLRDEACMVTYSVPSTAIQTTPLTYDQYNLDNSTGTASADTEDNTLEYQEYTVHKEDLTRENAKETSNSYDIDGVSNPKDLVDPQPAYPESGKNVEQPEPNVDCDGNPV